ncbi:MAG: MmgE/PrpD family protein [Parasporobacterium sp.]|nr:MmgE/PrpD family protein [Parasporobacterium sp.]
MSVTDKILDFAETYGKYENLPPEVVHEVKMLLLDGIGNALAGIASDKGKIGVEMAHQIGGNPVSSVIGTGGKVSAPMAAFANAELLNGLDMDPIPHVPPLVIPSVLATAEMEKLDGKKLIASLAVGLELGMRICGIFGMVMIISYMKYNKTPDCFSNGNESVIAAAVADAVAMGLSREQIANALGIAAYYCTLPVCRDWESSCPKTMVKYAPLSFLAQGSVEAAMLARAGYTGTTRTLDNEFGFPVYDNNNKEIWNEEKMAGALGERWDLLSIIYKPYPCCSFIHPVLDCFRRIVDRERLSRFDIDEVQCYTAPFNAHPDQYAVENQIDVQFSAPYCFALMINHYPVGAGWQSKKALRDPDVREFMPKVKMNVAPEYAQYRKTDPKSWYGRVELKTTDGRVFREETMYPTGAKVPGYAFSDEDMINRFREMGSEILTDEKLCRASDIIMNLEKQDSLDGLFANITL